MHEVSAIPDLRGASMNQPQWRASNPRDVLLQGSLTIVFFLLGQDRFFDELSDSGHHDVARPVSLLQQSFIDRNYTDTDTNLG